MTGALTEKAYAKLNLALHVRSRRPDGFHDIETVFAFCEEGDWLGIDRSDDLSLRVVGPFAEAIPTGSDNLVLKAAAALRETIGVGDGAALVLFKNLPVASGIGGGSADAAAALRLLRSYWNLGISEERLLKLAAPLGADVPVCVGSRSTLGRGKGDVLQAVATGFESAPVLLVNPRVAVATGQVFAAWDGHDRGSLDPADPLSWRNDLTDPAIAIAPAIRAVLGRLEAQNGTRLVRMSGSGATCFAIFESDAERDAAVPAFADCWTLATRLRSV